MKDVALKIVQTIKKHDNFFVILLIIVSICGVTMYVSLESLDELWNFQNTYKMYNGFQIYQDANVIVTPLFFWIGELLLTIVGANLLTFRIYNIIIITSLYFITYLLLKSLKIDKKLAILFLTFIVFNSYTLVLAQANYNTMALMWSVLGVLLYIKKPKNNTILQGVLLFLIFSAKQNIGIFYAIGLFCSEILTENKLKTKVKNIIIESFVFLSLFILLLLYFYYDNNLYHFINYAVLGIQEFANENFHANVSNMILAVFFVSINIILTTIFIRHKKVDMVQKTQLIVLNCFAIPLVLIMIPIFNRVHFLLGSYLATLLFIYLANIFLQEVDVKIKNKIIYIIIVILSTTACLISIAHLIDWVCVVHDKDYQFKKEEPFYGGIYRKELIENINHVTRYIENSDNQIIILSHKASLYMIPTKRSNGMMDLPFKGNLGKEGEKGLIEQIKNIENVEILIEKEEDDIHYQESKLAREYIIQNMDKIGEIEEFEIYQSK